MNLDLIIVYMLLNIEYYNKYNTYIDYNSYKINNREIYRILYTIKKMRQDREDDISIDDLVLTFNSLSGNLKEEEKQAYGILFDRLREVKITDSAAEDYFRGYLEKKKAQDIAVLAIEVVDGKKQFSELQESFADFPAESILDEVQFVTDDLHELYSTTRHLQGLRWPLDCLNKSLGSLRGGDFGFILARPECLHPDTPVMLSNGRSVKASSIVVGDSLMGPDSLPREVTGTCYGQQQMYKITYPWGESYTVNENHILSLKRSKKEGSHSNGDILNVTVKEYLTWPQGRKERYKGWKSGIDLPHNPVEIPPYVLGVWLGDGTSSAPAITNMDKEVIDCFGQYANTLGAKCSIFTRKSQGKARTVYIAKNGGVSNPFKQLLRKYNLLDNKHIPEEYLYNSADVRLELLAGLLDTDGSVSKNSYEITQVRKHVAESIVYLARSLGFHSTIKEKIVNSASYWRVSIYGDVHEIPLRVAHKVIHKPTVVPKRKGLHFGFTVTPMGMGEYFGFTLTGDHLFLLGDFTVTHNTGKTTFLAHVATHMTEQHNGNTLFVNNEERGSKVKVRNFQALFGKTSEELFGDIQYFNNEWANRIGNRLRLYDDATITIEKIEQLAKELKPKLIIIDQIDKIKGIAGEGHGMLKELYQWGRELAKKHNCPVIAVSQASAPKGMSGGASKEKFYLDMNDIDGSKTGKPGEADWILGIGLDEDNPGIRGFSVIKNKLTGDDDSSEQLRHMKKPVRIFPEIARYGEMN